MQWVRTILLSTLAVLWLPVTIHCHLESLTGLEFLSCGTQAEQAPHQEKDCNDDGCADVESGLYHMEYQSLDLRAPLLDRTMAMSSPMDEVKVLPLWDNLDPPETAPPELCTEWRFSLRVALSPRAPSSIA